MPDAIKGSRFGIGSVGVLQGISLGGLTSSGGNGNNKFLQVGVKRSDAQGMPFVPSLEIQFWGSWRFRWVVAAGSRSISVWAMQVVNLTPRPAIVIKANPDVGLNADVTAVAPAGTGWVHTPDAAFVASVAGVVWVELWNRVQSQNAPVFFDRIVTV